MNEYETKKLLEQYNLSYTEFRNWMRGQTVGMINGKIDYYIQDVLKFIDIKLFGTTKLEID